MARRTIRHLSIGVAFALLMGGAMFATPTADALTLPDSYISVDQTTATATGADPITVTAVAYDGTASLMPGATIDFSVTGEAQLSANQCTTGDGTNGTTLGQCDVTVTDVRAETVTLRATVPADDGPQDLENSPIDLTFTPGSADQDLTAEVGLVVVSGTLSVGDTLDAAVFDVVPESASLTYQWYRDDEPIDQATDATYTVTADDLTPYLTLVVTASAPGYDPGTKEVPILKVGSVDKPVITGDPSVGSRLTATSANMDAFGTLVYSWQRVSGTVSTTVPDATGSMYLVSYDDVGMQVRACVSDVEYPTPLFCSTATDEIVEQHGMGALPPVAGTLALSDYMPWIGHPTTATVTATNTITGAPDGAGIPVTFTVSGSATLSADGGQASTDGQSLQVLTDENGQATVTVNDMTVEKVSVTAVFTNFPVTVSGSPAEAQFLYGMGVVPPSVDPAQSSVSVDQTMATVGQPITATLVVKGITGIMLSGQAVSVHSTGDAVLSADQCTTGNGTDGTTLGTCQVTVTDATAESVSLEATVTIDGAPVEIAGSPVTLVFAEATPVDNPDNSSTNLNGTTMTAAAASTAPTVKTGGTVRPDRLWGLVAAGGLLMAGLAVAVRRTRQSW